MGYQFWLSYFAVISFMIYSGLCVSYYSSIAHEKMQNGNRFCLGVGHTGSSDIAAAQMVGITLLTLSVALFVLKINHDVFAQCDYSSGKASGLVESVLQYTPFWWGLLITIIYGISIYNLTIVDRFEKCPEDVTNNDALLAINSAVVGIISIIILIVVFYLIKGWPLPFINKE